MKTIAELTIEEFRDILRQAVAEAQGQQCYLDEEGYLVFTSERAYAHYLQEHHKGKSPKRVKAYWIDEHGIKNVYSDWHPTPEEIRRMEEGSRQIREGKFVTLDELEQKLGLGRWSRDTKSRSQGGRKKKSPSSREKSKRR